MNPSVVIEKHLTNIRRDYVNMTAHQYDEAGPCIRACIVAMERWKDAYCYGGTEAEKAASALCDAADEIIARKGWPTLNDTPWKGSGAIASEMLRDAELLCPRILDDDRKRLAGLLP